MIKRQKNIVKSQLVVFMIFYKDYIVDEVMSNGRKMTYARAFSKTYGKLYNVSEQCIYLIIKAYV